MFVLDKCVIRDDNAIMQTWITPMLSDPAYLHVASVISQKFLERIAGRKQTAEARRQEFISVDKSIGLLSKRIATADRSAVLSDSTLMTVLNISAFVAF